METHDIKAQSVRDSFDSFSEKSIHLRDLMNRNNKKKECVYVCVGCMCFPCIFCSGVVEYIFGPKKKEDTLL